MQSSCNRTVQANCVNWVIAGASFRIEQALKLTATDLRSPQADLYVTPRASVSSDVTENVPHARIKYKIPNYPRYVYTHAMGSSHGTRGHS